jgi:hypothetical protein
MLHFNRHNRPLSTKQIISRSVVFDLYSDGADLKSRAGVVSASSAQGRAAPPGGLNPRALSSSLYVVIFSSYSIVTNLGNSYSVAKSTKQSSINSSVDTALLKYQRSKLVLTWRLEFRYNTILFWVFGLFIFCWSLIHWILGSLPPGKTGGAWSWTLYLHLVSG